ncbi:MAG: hypothetical protein ABIJ34_05495 [archaeon]
MKLFLKGIKKGFTGFGENLAAIINSLLLTAVYLIGIGLPSIFGKLICKKFLQMEKKDSYWQPVQISEKTENHYKQF